MSDKDIETGVTECADCIATAVFVHTEGGDDYLFVEQDGFTPESLIDFLKDKMENEFPWIGMLYIEGLNWDASMCSLGAVWGEISKELDKVDVYGG